MTSQDNDTTKIDVDVEALRRKYAEERNKRLHTKGFDLYMKLRGQFADFDLDPWTSRDLTRTAVSEEVDALIIGGGIAGLMMGARLRERRTCSLRIIEKGGDFGGTWYWNRYPGAACDVESYIYLPLLEETGYMPTEKYAKATEIQAYLKKLAEHFDLYSAALFQTVVTELRWNEDSKRWVVRTDRGDVIAARFVVSCTGFLSSPKLPKIPGIESFNGRSFHTSRWDYAYTGGDQYSERLTNLQDKTLAIIGTGSSSIQATPRLAEWVKHLYVFQRTPSSIDLRGNQRTDPAWVKTLRHGWQAERSNNFVNITSGIREPDLVQDGWTDIFKHITGAAVAHPASAEQRQVAGLLKMERTRQRIEEAVKDKATAEALKPWYDYFCKRPGFSDGEYLDTFNRPNVTLVDTDGQGVERITPNGLVVKGKEYPVDCIVYATGFDYLTDYTREAGLEAYGRGGILLSEHWAEGPRTLLGMMTDRFPNLFFTRIPQSGPSVNYTTNMNEQTNYIGDLIKRCVDSKKVTIDATSEAVDSWVEEVIAKAGPRQATLAACTPGYYNYEGDPTRRRALLLNEVHGDGPLVYFKILTEQRMANEVKGIKFQ